MAIIEQISVQEKVDFVRNLSLLIKSGKPINESFELLTKQVKSPALRKAILEAKEKTEKGTPIHKVFEENKNFDNVFVSFIRAGEESGTLDENLVFLGDWLERQSNLKKEMSSATLYPKIIVTFALILGGVLSIFVLPQLMEVFGTLDVQLPLTTRILIFISDTTQEHGLLTMVAIIAILVLGFLALKVDWIRKRLDILLINIPVFGVLNREYQLTIISQLASILFKSGLTVRQTLQIVEQSVTNNEYKKSLNNITKRVERGTKLSDALMDYPKLYPDVFISVVATGETAGSFGESLSYLAGFFSDRVTERTKKLPTVIEPLLLIFIGVVVAFIASAIIMPIYEITRGLY